MEDLGTPEEGDVIILQSVSAEEETGIRDGMVTIQALTIFFSPFCCPREVEEENSRHESY